MATRTFRINGSVIDADTQKPVPGVRVEAWNNATPQHIVLGSGTTDAQGRFQIVGEAELSPTSFATTGATTTGIVSATLNVFLGTQALTAAGDTTVPNLFDFQRSAVLQVHLKQADEPLKDHVTVDQVVTAVDFVHQSDFVGVFREGRDRTTAIGTVLKESLKSLVKSVNVKPLQPSAVRNRDVINQDAATARQRLGQQGVKVDSVLAYEPGLGTLGNLPSVARTLKPGQTVDLYQENGVVKAYKIVTPSTPSTTDQLSAEVNTLQNDVRQVKAVQDGNTALLAALQQKTAMIDQLQAQLTTVQAQSAQKDQTITKLQSDVAAVRAANDALAAKVSPDRIAALEETVRKLQTK